jgi:muramoyltetrapeptide carboxypeptidase LdcA involved in peptidoglycan recycling
MRIISQTGRSTATKRLESLGFTVSFGAHCEATDPRFRDSSSIEHRIADLHEAFRDPTVDAILTIIGGFSANQLLDSIDYDLIRSNPKVFCGFSDITTFQNAFLEKAGLISFSGPHWSTFGMEKELEYTVEQFVRVLCQSEPNEWISVPPSLRWRDDAWFMDPLPKNLFENDGYQVVQRGIATGTIVGGNVDVLGLLRGTPYFPLKKDIILFLEGTQDVKYEHFDQLFQALLYIPTFKDSIRGIVIGRFQMNSKISIQDLKHIFETKKLDPSIPIVYGLDFGHTTPHFPIPIGGQCKIEASDQVSVSVAW